MTFGPSDLKRAAAIAAIVAAITALHYGTSPHRLPLHVVYREMYLVPILLAALYFGKWGGIATAGVITAFYVPHVAMSIHTAESTVGNVLEIVFFYLFGAAVGSYADIRRSYQRTIRRTGDAPTRRFGRKILVCIDESAAGQRAAGYAGDLFGKDPEASITLLCAPELPNPDFFSKSSSAANEASLAIAAAEGARARSCESMTFLSRASAHALCRRPVRDCPI